MQAMRVCCAQLACRAISRLFQSSSTPRSSGRTKTFISTRARWSPTANYAGPSAPISIFAPTVQTIYPEGYGTFVEVEKLGQHLCGAFRPGHFRGVATIVLKLFNIVLPDFAFFGQKDAQQVRIIQQMACDLDLQLEVVTLPTVRETDGLAMSSRNRYLDPLQRQQATVLYRSLRKVHEMVANGERNVAKIESMLKTEIETVPGAKLDYAQVVDVRTLQPIELLSSPAIAALAVFFGATRLIDNATLTP